MGDALRYAALDGEIRPATPDGATVASSSGRNPVPEHVKRILEACYSYLESHECSGERWGKRYYFYKPSMQKYGPYQWLWDSGAHQIVWSHRDVQNSIADLRSLLSMQLRNGMIPEMTFWGSDKVGCLPRFLQTLWYSNKRHTDITQTPVLPFALRSIWEATQNTALLREFVPPLIRYFDWWARQRDIDCNGLLAIIHGWESGMDASPAYDRAYGITEPKPAFKRLYPRLLKTLLTYKLRFKWNQAAIAHHPRSSTSLFDKRTFVVFDVGLNCVYAAGWGILATLAAAAGLASDVEAHCLLHQSIAESAILKHCYCERLGRFVSLYKDAEGSTCQSDAETAQSLFPLLLRSLPRDKAERIVKEQLTNPEKFWRRVPVPSVSADSPHYEPGPNRLLWRGPTWPILSWCVMEGLVLHGYTDVANRLLDRWIAAYQESGVWEQYNPDTAEGMGTEGLGMSTLIVDWLYRLDRLPKPSNVADNPLFELGQ